MTIQQAFDELRFGPGRTLNLRPLQPTARQAATLVEQWLREQQVRGSGEVLVITGRGNNSVEGYSPVREAIVKLLPSLRRRHVIAGYAEHTAGSFVVTLASVNALFEAPRRRREKGSTPPPVTPTALEALEEETVRQLRELAMLSLAALGVQSPTRAQLDDEMQRHFQLIAGGLPMHGDREALLQQAVLRAAEAYEGG